MTGMAGMTGAGGGHVDHPSDTPAAAPRRTLRTLGVLGGMSWESTALYYRGLNQGVAQRLGGLHSAPLLLHSVDFAAVAALQRADDWPAAAALLSDAAIGLCNAGAQALVIATNTMHKVAAQVEAACGLPLLHIADATGCALARAGVRSAGLLGTRFTMDDPAIVRDRLARRHGVQTLVPPPDERTAIDRIVFDELCRGVVRGASRERFVAVIAALRDRGAEAVVLGCTELALLVDAACSPLPVFDTTSLHVQAALAWMFDDDPAGEPRE